MKRLKDKCAGGTSGIGAETARLFAGGRECYYRPICSKRTRAKSLNSVDFSRQTSTKSRLNPVLNTKERTRKNRCVV